MNKLILTFLFCTVLSGISAQTNSLIYQRLHPYKIPGITSTVLSGNYPVFENRASKKGRLISLNIIVIPALHADSVLTPIFYFEGGPGVAATNNASFYADSSNKYCLYHDIVLVDIRGTGNSNPLNCPSLQIKHSLKDQFEDMYPPGEVKECYDSLSKKADLKQYTTTNAVKDLEELRQWLGYGKINIYGLSYGTRVALVYMKMFPSSVESCILWSPIPTYGKMPLYHARFAQNSLEKIFTDCSNDSVCQNAFPNLTKEFNSLMQQSQKTAFRFFNSSSSQQLSFSWNTFQTKLRSLMYSPGGIRQIPYIIHQAYIGNLSPFVSLYPQASDTSTFIAEGLYLCITCSEDVPFINNKEVDSLTKGTFVGTYRIEQQESACAQWTQGNIPDNFFDPTISKIPTLIFSGGFDPITPTVLAKEIASHLSNSLLIVIPQMAHTFDGLSHPECFDNICLDFIKNPLSPKLESDCIKEMKPGNYRVKE